jgi:hypothetical protein
LTSDKTLKKTPNIGSNMRNTKKWSPWISPKATHLEQTTNKLQGTTKMATNSKLQQKQTSIAEGTTERAAAPKEVLRSIDRE